MHSARGPVTSGFPSHARIDLSMITSEGEGVEIQTSRTQLSAAVAAGEDRSGAGEEDEGCDTRGVGEGHAKATQAPIEMPAMMALLILSAFCTRGVRMCDGGITVLDERGLEK
jgi:hypothetical protein